MVTLVLVLFFLSSAINGVYGSDYSCGVVKSYRYPEVSGPLYEIYGFKLDNRKGADLQTEPFVATVHVQDGDKGQQCIATSAPTTKPLSRYRCTDSSGKSVKLIGRYLELKPKNGDRLNICFLTVVGVLYKKPEPTPQPPPPTKCESGAGYHTITINVGGKSYNVQCYNQWIVMQSRGKCKESFDRDWNDYKNGFGSLDTDLWLGNQKVHELTSHGRWKLRVEVQSPTNHHWYHADYADFKIGSESEKYKLMASGHSGTAAEAFYRLGRNVPFVTRDRDNSRKCGRVRRNGFWFTGCSWGNLNGACRNDAHYRCGRHPWVCMIWWRVSTKQALQAARMMIQPYHWPDSSTHTSSNKQRCRKGDGYHVITVTVNGETRQLNCYNDWILMQSRGKCLESFDKDWHAYKNGFGSIERDYWLGNEVVHQLTHSEPYRLRVEVQSPTNHHWYHADYADFKIGSESEKYKLMASGHSGTAAEAFYRLGRNVPFVTRDRDNSRKCGRVRRNGFWFTGCSWGNLNGACRNDAHYRCGRHPWVCMIWWRVSTKQALQAARMMIKPKSWH